MNDRYIDDISQIKDMMNRSSRFISLSGWSGVSTGIVAMAGAYSAYYTVYRGQDYFSFRRATLDSDTLVQLFGIGIMTLALTIALGIYFTTKEAKKNDQAIWDFQTRRLIINLAIPLISGGLFCIILLVKGYIGLVAPITLIFYGLGLVNASKYTLGEIRSLGILQIILGLVATYFIGYGLLFWIIGFGLLHIIYGIYMQVTVNQ